MYNKDIKISEIPDEILEKGKEAIELFLNGKATGFSFLNSNEELIGYLNSRKMIMNSRSKLMYQYTSYAAFESMVSGKYLYIGNPSKMNDGLELEQSLCNSGGLFFSSFMLEKQESIAMWSMYGQPWSDGIRIGIPLKQVYSWIESTEKVYRANTLDKSYDKKEFLGKEHFKIMLSRVAYINDKGNVTCGEKRNLILKELQSPELAGYIKDGAWSYEKEIRLKINIDHDSYGAVAIEMPKGILDSIEVTCGPRFEHNKERDKLLAQFHAIDSLFYNKLKYVYCDSCKGEKK